MNERRAKPTTEKGSAVSSDRLSQRVENTSGCAPIEHLAGMLRQGTDDYITSMESAGQRQLVNSDVLPAQGDWDWLGELGVIRGEPVTGDDLFVHATIPDGWKREGSDHAMGSYLVDERGVQRVSIFYKAAFYDRKASISVINVGGNLSTQAIYGDTPASLPACWDVLTKREKRDFRKSLDNYLTEAKQHPNIYGDRVDKVRALVAKAVQR